MERPNHKQPFSTISHHTISHLHHFIMADIQIWKFFILFLRLAGRPPPGGQSLDRISWPQSRFDRGYLSPVLLPPRGPTLPPAVQHCEGAPYFLHNNIHTTLSVRSKLASWRYRQHIQRSPACRVGHSPGSNLGFAEKCATVRFKKFKIF